MFSKPDFQRESIIPAVLYRRVSSKRQVKEGDGLQSQEQRCRSYAEARGYRVVDVFGDDGVSGALLNRPGIQKLLAFLRAQPGQVIVIVDDISRIARDVKTHIELRSVITAAGGVLESPSMKFEDNAAGEFIEMVLAASAQFGRKGNREQVLNRQKARLQMGYWTFPAPLGYRYVAHPVHKKLLVPTDEAKRILAPALKAFAFRQLATYRELSRHLQEAGFYGVGSQEPISILEKRLGRILDALPLYAGFIEYLDWGVERTKGQHEAIISADIFSRLQERLRTPGPLSPERADSHSKFILRNFIRCPECGRPYTGCLAKGLYPRYFCYAQGKCERYGRSISARLLEPAFEALLQSVEPTDELLESMRVLSTTAWQRRLAGREREYKALEQEIEKQQDETEMLLRRLARTVDDEVANELEKLVRVQKQESVELEEKLRDLESEPPDYEAAFKGVSTLIRHPYLLWKNGSDSQKRTVHRAVFTVPPAFDRNEGFSTYELTLPYLISATYRGFDSRLVEVAGESWQNFAREILDLQSMTGAAMCLR